MATSTWSMSHAAEDHVPQTLAAIEDDKHVLRESRSHGLARRGES